MRTIRGTKIGWSNLRRKHDSKPKKIRKNKKKKRPQMRCYAKRDARLEFLGHKTYQAYLASEDWNTIRKEKLDLCSTCICGKKANQVHHIRYDTPVLLGLLPDFLISLCAKCHLLIEFNGSEKLELAFANNKLWEHAAQCKKGILWRERMLQKKVFNSDGFANRICRRLRLMHGVDRTKSGEWIKIEPSSPARKKKKKQKQKKQRQILPMVRLPLHKIA